MQGQPALLVWAQASPELGARFRKCPLGKQGQPLSRAGAPVESTLGRSGGAPVLGLTSGSDLTPACHLAQGGEASRGQGGQHSRGAGCCVTWRGAWASGETPGRLPISTVVQGGRYPLGVSRVMSGLRGGCEAERGLHPATFLCSPVSQDPLCAGDAAVRPGLPSGSLGVQSPSSVRAISLTMQRPEGHLRQPGYP